MTFCFCDSGVFIVQLWCLWTAFPRDRLSIEQRDKNCGVCQDNSRMPLLMGCLMGQEGQRRLKGHTWWFGTTDSLPGSTVNHSSLRNQNWMQKNCFCKCCYRCFLSAIVDFTFMLMLLYWRMTLPLHTNNNMRQCHKLRRRSDIISVVVKLCEKLKISPVFLLFFPSALLSLLIQGFRDRFNHDHDTVVS